MALIVEDGTGRSDADALISLAFSNTFHTDRNNTDWTGTATDAEKEAAIRNASSFLGGSFKWRGYPVGTRDQTMPFPRTDLYDRYGYAVASNVVPREVEECVALLALYDYQNAGAFTQVAFAPQSILKRKKIGPLEKEYAIFQSNAQSARPQMVFAMDLIAPFLSVTTGRSGLVGQRSR